MNGTVNCAQHAWPYVADAHPLHPHFINSWWQASVIYQKPPEDCPPGGFFTLMQDLGVLSSSSTGTQHTAMLISTTTQKTFVSATIHNAVQGCGELVVTSLTSHHIPKLNGGKYFVWSIQTKAVLLFKKLWSAIMPGYVDEQGKARTIQSGGTEFADKPKAAFYLTGLRFPKYEGFFRRKEDDKRRCSKREDVAKDKTEKGRASAVHKSSLKLKNDEKFIYKLTYKQKNVRNPDKVNQPKNVVKNE
ncbi:hypothetical protein PR048_012308 [Dryococelus australis]|uniref:Uncharacterized protein n=1 Tax=Dryococelus australis TaxID=614101 RepID=A0ABQ9HP21_9NEOP|nr:hypothetical protein PR048_012308 [Dryococelus australis]